MFEIGQIVQIRSNRGGVVGHSVAKKIGKTTVTLENGERYRLRDRRQVGTDACAFYYSF